MSYEENEVHEETERIWFAGDKILTPGFAFFVKFVFFVTSYSFKRASGPDARRRSEIAFALSYSQILEKEMMRRLKTCPQDFRGFVSVPTGDGTTVDMVDFERIHGARALDDVLALEGMNVRRDAKPGEPIMGFTSPEAEAEFQRQVLAACNEIGVFDADEVSRH